MKAVIEVGGQQHLVSAGDQITIDNVAMDKTSSIEPLLVFDDDKITVGNPIVKGAKVAVEMVEANLKGSKVKIVKFQSKKRVKKITGHRQPQAQLKIKSVSVK